MNSHQAVTARKRKRLSEGHSNPSDSDPADAETMLTAVANPVRRFVALAHLAFVDALAIWIAHPHAIDARKACSLVGMDLASPLLPTTASPR